MSGIHGAGLWSASELPQRNGNSATAVSVPLTGDARLDGLIGGMKWNGPITYSDPDAAADYGAGYVSDGDGNGVSAQLQGFSQMTAQQMVAAHFILGSTVITQPAGSLGFSVAGFTNLGLSYAGAGSGVSTIRLANSEDANPTAYAYYPSNGALGGDSFFGTSSAGTPNDLKNPVAGNYAWHTMIHEIGHSLGLKHGHEVDGRAALPSNVDSPEYSVMTYRSYIGGPTDGYQYGSWDAPQTFMMLDIAALQHLYGADYTTNSGNTTYSWSPNNGQTRVDGQVGIDPGGSKIFMTVWDGGGVDTYDLSAYSTSLSIDLRPGEHSTFSAAQLAELGGGPNGGFARGNVFNAQLFGGDTRSLIENAAGGSGGDVVHGNQASNLLRGNGGVDTLHGHAGADDIYGGSENDSIFGGDGDDNLDGGAGADALDGGLGWDIAWYSNAAGPVTVDLGGFVANTGEAAGDTLNLIDGIWGSTNGDLLLGDQWSNRLFGHAGADNIYGRGGNDDIYGQEGNDNFDGGAGADRFFGGDGFDFVYYSTATSGIRADLGNFLTGVGDSLNDFFDEFVDGLVGSVFDDMLWGDEWSNTLRGHEGNDKLDGGGLNDSLYGGGGVDEFRFTQGSGWDTIFDFVDSVDLLDFRSWGFSSVNQALSLAVDTGSNILFDFGGGVRLTVANIANVDDLAQEILIS